MNSINLSLLWIEDIFSINILHLNCNFSRIIMNKHINPKVVEIDDVSSIGSKLLFQKIENKFISEKSKCRVENPKTNYKLVKKGPYWNAFNRASMSSIPRERETVLIYENSRQKGFISTTERFIKDNRSATPGPGQYSGNNFTIKQNAFITSNTSFNNSKGFGNGFISQTERFDDSYLFKSKYTPGPGDYSNDLNKTNSSFYHAASTTTTVKKDHILSKLNEEQKVFVKGSKGGSKSKQIENIHKHLEIGYTKGKYLPDFGKSKVRRIQFSNFSNNNPGPCDYFIQDEDGQQLKNNKLADPIDINNKESIIPSPSVEQYKKILNQTTIKERHRKTSSLLRCKEINKIIDNPNQINSSARTDEEIRFNSFLHSKVKYNQGKSSYRIDNLQKFLPLYHYNIERTFDKYSNPEVEGSGTNVFINNIERKFVISKKNKFPGPAFYFPDAPKKMSHITNMGAWI